MAETLRIDKWLWYARFFKSRTLAQKICTSGKVRVNKEPVSKAHATIRVGDVLTFSQGPHVRVIEVVALGTRRGPAPEAQGLYSDLAPPQPEDKTQTPDVPKREHGAGRPTKKDRRAIDRLRS